MSLRPGRFFLIIEHTEELLYTTKKWILYSTKRGLICYEKKFWCHGSHIINAVAKLILSSEDDLPWKLALKILAFYLSSNSDLCWKYLSISAIRLDNRYLIWCRWTSFDRLMTIWKSEISDKIKQKFFQAVTMLVQLYGCNTWTLTKHQEQKPDGNYTKMLHAVLNKFW